MSIKSITTFEVTCKKCGNYENLLAKRLQNCGWKSNWTCPKCGCVTRVSKKGKTIEFEFNPFSDPEAISAMALRLELNTNAENTDPFFNACVGEIFHGVPNPYANMAHADLVELLTGLIRPLMWSEVLPNLFMANTEIGIMYRVYLEHGHGETYWGSTMFNHGRGQCRDTKEECIEDCEQHYKQRVLMLFDLTK